MRAHKYANIPPVSSYRYLDLPVDLLHYIYIHVIYVVSLCTRSIDLSTCRSSLRYRRYVERQILPVLVGVRYMHGCGDEGSPWYMY